MKKQPKLGSGARFAKLSNTVASEYVARGKSPSIAKKIGDAVAAKIGRAKYGKKKMTAMSIKGKKGTTTYVKRQVA